MAYSISRPRPIGNVQFARCQSAQLDQPPQASSRDQTRDRQAAQPRLIANPHDPGYRPGIVRLSASIRESRASHFLLGTTSGAITFRRHRLRPLNPVGPVNKIKEAMKRSELVKRYRIAERRVG